MLEVGRVVCVLTCVFFFQAEDGIRDLVRSRGLGDVYKRQRVDHGEAHALRRTGAGQALRDGRGQTGDMGLGDEGQVLRRTEQLGPVSYTHLTLPTIYSV